MRPSVDSNITVMLYITMVCILIDAMQFKGQGCFWYNYAVVDSNEEIILLLFWKPVRLQISNIIAMFKLRLLKIMMVSF